MFLWTNKQNITASGLKQVSCLKLRTRAEEMVVHAIDKVFLSRTELLYFSYFSTKNVCCGYSLDVPQRRASNEHQEQHFGREIRKIFTDNMSYLDLWVGKK